MITLNKLLYDIKNIAYGGTQSDDTPISDRQVAYWINQLRAQFVSQALNKRLSIPDAFVQFIECIPLECVDKVECCNGSSEEFWLRSTQKIPATIQRNGKNTVTAVYSSDQNKGFSETTYYRQRTNKYNTYTAHKPRWFFKDNYLYITNDKLMDEVSLAGVFEDPTEVSEFKKCDGSLCFTWDMPYPVTGAISSLITNTVLKEKMGIVLQAPRDDSNDGRGQTESTITNERD